MYGLAPFPRPISWCLPASLLIILRVVDPTQPAVVTVQKEGERERGPTQEARGGDRPRERDVWRVVKSRLAERRLEGAGVQQKRGEREGGKKRERPSGARSLARSWERDSCKSSPLVCCSASATLCRQKGRDRNNVKKKSGMLRGRLKGVNRLLCVSKHGFFLPPPLHLPSSSPCAAHRANTDCEYSR